MWNSLRIRLTVIFIGLAIGPLLLVGTILAQRSFASEREQALDLQQQVAQRVAAELEAFLQEVANDLRSLSGEIRDLEQPDRAQQLSLLLEAFNSGPYRQVYEEFTLLDGQGREQLRVSRTDIIPTNELGSRAGTDEFEQPKAIRGIYFGPIEFDPTSGEPLMTLAVPLFEPRSVQLNGVLVAQIRFKTVGDLISTIQISGNQTIYVVDLEGKVVAHQDSSVVLRDKHFDLSTQVNNQIGLTGTDVVLGDAPVHQLDQPILSVVAERPTVEALDSAYNTMYTVVYTLLIALVIAAGLGFLVVRQIVRPIEALSTTAQAIIEGDLTQQVEVTSQDELGKLAGAFNGMTAQLRDLIDGLEDRVYERTRALETSAQISRQVTTILNIDKLLQYVVSFIQKEFNFYHVHIYLVDAETGDLVITEGSGEVGRQLKEQGHRLPAGQGIVGTVAALNEHFLSNNVNEVLNFVRNPLLPHTNSELAVPLRKADQVLGVLDIQSEQTNRFTAEDVALMQTIANQTAVALDNARLLNETQAALKEVERLNRQLTREVWQQFGEEVTTSGYRFVAGNRKKISPASDAWLPPMKEAALQKQLVTQTHPGNGDPAKAELAVPLLLRGQVIGVLGVKREETPDWAEEEVAAVEAVANQVALALENARLSKEQAKTIVQLKDIDRLKSEFLTSMSHELRTPLNSIIGFADVLLQGIDGELNDMALNDVQLIHNSGKHLLALINDILDLSKIEAGKMELVREAVDIKDVANAVLASSHSLVKDKPVEIVTDVSDMLPPVYADKLRLNQILLNLVSNAAKFTHEGTITIKASLNPRKLDVMTISVIDTGIGIPASKLSTIFERFRQADSSTTRKYGGTGLGLAICRQLVEMHGGTLNVRSEEGVGSEFYFAIPLA
ncbi:MAG: GAF domain-containing protein [Anaerolineae bacterium]|nr:GAF domain-containing protein [Anaerolineae bacterium]